MKRKPLVGAAFLVLALFLAAASEKPPLEVAEQDATDAPAVATFAGGCFWCMEGPFDELDGVLSTTSGYTGGTVENPSYEQVSSGSTGHTEAVQILYDAKKVSYFQLLELFWHNIDPLDSRGQFCDRGSQYRSGIYWHDAAQRKLAENSRDALAASGRLDGSIVTEIVEAGAFYPAEEYHQNYSSKNPLRYHYYRRRCGRDRRLQEVWGDEAGGGHSAVGDVRSGDV